MRTSILIALLAVSFTAVLAAPGHNRVSVYKIHATNLKLSLSKLALAPKITILPPAKTKAIAPRIDFSELVALVSEALTQLEDAVIRADAALVEVLANSPVLEEVRIIVRRAEDQVVSTLSAAFEQALTTPLEDLPELMAVTAKAAQTTINNAALEVQLIVGEKAPELQDAVRIIALQLVSDVQNVVAPLLDLISPPESKAIAGEKKMAQNPGLRITLPELIELIRVAIAEVNTAIDSAARSLENLLIGTHIIEDVLGLVRAAESDALRVIEETIVVALQTPIEELPALLERLVVQLQTLFTDAVGEIQDLVGREAEELVTALDGIVLQLASDIAAAIQPIIDALNPPELH